MGCGAPVEPAIGSTPSTPAAAPPAVEPAPAVAVGGRLRAHDGGPLRTAEFTLSRRGFIEPAATGDLRADGTFHAAVEPGVYVINFTAVDHAQSVQWLLVERSLDVQGTLGTYARADPGDTLPLKTELLAADGSQLSAGPATAVRTAAGVYRLDLADKPEQAVKLRYQLVSPGGRTYNGPLADAHESDGGGDYWSVVALAGRDAIDLDLAALPPAGTPAALTWSGDSPELLAVRAFQERWQPRIERLDASTPRKDGKIFTPGAQERARSAALAAEALAEADAAGSGDARILLRLAHLDLFTRYDDDEAARGRAGWIVDHVDPVDPRLGLFFNVLNVLGRALASADPEFTARTEAWLTRMQANPDPDRALAAISTLLHRADERGDDARVAELYAASQAPRFAGLHATTHLARRFDPDRVLQRGKPLPEFEFPALAEGAPAITRAERAGRLYLVEFWATWCGPCVAEMESVHTAYAKVNGGDPRGGPDDLRRLGPVARPRIEFVFVSFDEDAADVRRFRDEHWSMPWTHAFVGRAGERAVMDRFGFSGVPTAVLVDGDGTIVAVGQALRGERLLTTLERALTPGP